MAKYWRIPEGNARIERFITEGICPGCRRPLVRTGIQDAECKPCALVWLSPRIPHVFPTRDDWKLPRDWSGGTPRIVA